MSNIDILGVPPGVELQIIKYMYIFIHIYTYVSFNCPDIFWLVSIYCICIFKFTNVFYMKLYQANGLYRFLFF